MASRVIHLLFVFAFALVCYADDSCECHYQESPCLQHTMKECVDHLWKIPQNVTATVREFEKAIKLLVTNADDRLLGYLVSLSLWVVDHFSGMPTHTHPSCIYGTLLNHTLASNLLNDSCTKKGLTKARSKYGGLCLSGVNNTIYVGMKMAGCKIKVPQLKCGAPCKIGSAPQMLLADSTSEIPESLKPIMLKLATSTQIDEQAVAAAAFGASTKASIDFFQGAIGEESFKKAVQLKACKKKIPKKFCKEREEELRSCVEALQNFTKTSLGLH